MLWVVTGSPATNSKYALLQLTSKDWGNSGTDTSGSVVPPDCVMFQSGGDVSNGLYIYADDNAVQIRTDFLTWRVKLAEVLRLELYLSLASDQRKYTSCSQFSDSSLCLHHVHRRDPYSQ